MVSCAHGGAFGVIGWFLKKYDYPPVAIVLGIVLGPIADSELIRTFLRFGDDWYLSFFTRPISLVMVVVMVALLGVQFIEERGRAA